jgi:hypothetical protein
MGQSARNAPCILVEEQPEWEFSGGFFRVTWCGQTWCYPPQQYFRMLAGMASLAREYRFTEGDVIPFPTALERVEA